LVGEAGSARASYDLMARFIQIFPMVPAPGVYLPLSAVLAGSSVLPRFFHRAAAVIAVGFLLLGLAGVLSPLAQAGSGGWSALQDLWILTAAVTLLLRRPPTADQ